MRSTLHISVTLEKTRLSDLDANADTTSNRPNFLPRGFEPPNHASPSTYPPSTSPSPLSRNPSTRSRPLSPPPPPLAHQNLSLHSRTQTQTSPTSPSLPASSIAEQSIFGSPPAGIIGIDKPREIIRIERDYSSGTGITQFWAGWIWELEGRVRTFFLPSLHPGKTDEGIGKGRTGVSDGISNDLE